MIDTPVTWNEVGVVSGIVVVGAVAIVGYFNSAFSKLRQAVENHRVEVAEKYATNDTVIRVEEKLTAAVDRMTDRMGQEMDKLSRMFEAVLSAFARQFGENHSPAN